MLKILNFGYGDPYVLEAVVAVLKEIVKRLPDEAPKLEGRPNVNLQD
jgi:hypothetical protein